MISFKSYLLENRIDFLKTQVKNIPTDHDPLGQHKEPSKIIDHFAEKADPSRKKIYTNWIINQYKKGSIRQEDHPRINTTLSNFDTYKNKLDKKDINQYSSLNHLEDTLEPHIGTHVSNKQEKAAIKHEGADLIHNGKDLMIHKLKTKEAACHYGSGTKWCTAAKENNMFDHYSEQGPLYVLTNKHNGEKHQFHFETDQFMNSKDEPIELHELVSKHPELKDVKEFKDSSHGYEFAKNKKEFEEAIYKALAHKNYDIRRTAIHHPNATPEHIDKALNDEDYTVREAAIQHKNATKKHITKALDDEDWEVRQSAIVHPKATPEHIDKALKDKDVWVRQAAIRHHNVTIEHINKALMDKDTYVRTAAQNKLNHFK